MRQPDDPPCPPRSPANWPQSVPARGAARRPRGGARRLGARPATESKPSPNCGAGKTDSAHEAAWLRAALALAICLLAARRCPALPPHAAKSAACHPSATAASDAGHQRNGREIYESFRAGLADPTCDAGRTSPRWQKHFAAAPERLATDDDVLPLFGYVVDALREADLPTEFALIPFVESGYKPGARSPAARPGCGS